jgi:hypothetical protein
MEVGGQRHAPVSLPRVERLGNRSTGGWVVDLRVRLDNLMKSCGR